MEVVPKRTATAITGKNRPIIRPEFADSMLVAEQGNVKNIVLEGNMMRRK
jgi:hypothetical protein